jgi:TPR repeat protein
LALASPSFAVGAQPADQTAPKVETILPIAELAYERAHYVDPKDVPALQRQAMHGSRKAAVKLAYYFGVHEDYRNQTYWLTIAVENGDDQQRLALARAYRVLGDDSANERALFWYRKIVREGPHNLVASAKAELGYLQRDMKRDAPRPPQP